MTDENVEVFVCMNVDCKSRGAMATMENLRQQLEDRRLTHIKPEAIICFSACNVGPNVVIPSKRCWLSGVTANDVGTVLDYLEGNAQIARFQEKNDPVLDKMIFEMIDIALSGRCDSRWRGLISSRVYVGGCAGQK